MWSGGERTGPLNRPQDEADLQPRGFDQHIRQQGIVTRAFAVIMNSC